MTARASLGVETSLTGRRWAGPSPETERAAEAIAQVSGQPLAVARVLARQGVAPADTGAYLSPKLRDLLPDPLVLKDMAVAADRLLAALDRKERIAIFADYDVDGGASAALLIGWLRAFGRQATLYIPDRIDEGYGPNAPAMAMLADAHDLIFCVDCGTLSHEAIAAARSADVVILDHHLAGEMLPAALACVNPNRQDEDGALGHLCATAVVFLLLVEAGRRLKAGGRVAPDLMAMLDLVALATVADVAALTGVNRALVRQGLAVMARRERPGLVALADAARMTRAPDTHALGFLIGPRVNAGGRIGKADLGARCLATDDADEAAALAARLDALNEERRAVEASVRAAAEAQVRARGVSGPLVWAAGEGWHPGVVGIVAARLKEAFHRPAVVIGIEGGIGKGSGRSVAAVDLGTAVQRLVAEGLLLKGGGHRMAAGLTVDGDKVEAAMARLSGLLARQGAGQDAPEDLRLDGLLAAQAVTPEFFDALEAAGPWGQGAPAPRFAFADMTVTARPVGERHLKLSLKAPDGARLDAVAFNAAEGPLAVLAQGGRFHIAGKLDRNDWGGRTRIEVRLDDAARA